MKPISLVELEDEHYHKWITSKEITKYLKIDLETVTMNYLVDYVNNNRLEGFENFAIFFESKFCGTLNFNHQDDIKKVGAYGIMIGDENAKNYGAGIISTAMILYFFLRILKLKSVGPEVTHKKNKNAISILNFFKFKPSENDEEEWQEYFLKDLNESTITKFESAFKLKIKHETIKTI